jgi:hypothetical protein
MSCVEVAVYAYDKASQGKVMIPAQPAKIDVKNTHFLKKMSITPGPMITPGDLETDPNFEMVLEWKDYRLLRDSRQKDALLSEMIRWISELNYDFHDSIASFGAKNIIYPARRTPLWPLVQKMTGAPNIDREIPRKTLGLMKVLSEAGDVLLKELRDKEAAYFQAHQRPMTNQQLRATLEQFRLADLETYQKTGKAPLHSLLRAR